MTLRSVQRWIPALLMACLWLSSAFPSAAETPTGRLPEMVHPVQYDLTLTIVPESERFQGVARIEVQIRERTSYFWIHGKGLHIQSASLILEDGSILAVRYDEVDEEGVARIRAPHPLEPQRAYLYLRYDAPFDEQLLGLYRIEEDSRWYAFTQFESIFARQCFPSFDEPSFRTPFDITLNVRPEDTAITNTLPIAETILPNGLKQIRFAQTVPLPTYLLAFAVGPFDVVNAPDLAAGPHRDRPIPFRGIAAHGKGERLRYALAQTPELFRRLEEYFGIPYPFEKLDLLAVPDFDYGAMENAGAITFDEYELLLDEANAPVEQVRNFALTMTHELSHQWFGDLVTIRWWDDIWLNESFATWMEHRIVQDWAPEQRSALAALEATVGAMRVDSLEASDPLWQPVERGSDAESRFDVIAYSKGGSVLAMFENYLGPERFRKGVQHFLEKRRLTSATSAEFLNDLTEATDSGIEKAFETFLYQAGVPLVDTEIQCGENQVVLSLRQQRYLPLGSKARAERIWSIPVCAQYEQDGNAHTQCALLTEREGKMELDAKACPAWVLPNADGTGYYRWSLPAEWYEKAARAPLSLTGKMSVADNLRAAFIAGRISMEEAMHGLAPFASSNERAIATIPMDVLRFAGEYILSGDLEPALRTYASSLYAEKYKSLGFETSESEDADARLLRSDVIEFLALVARDPEVRAEANRRGQAYTGFGGGEELHPEVVDENLAAVTLSVALQENGKPFLEALVRILGKTTDTVVRDQILSAIADAADPALAPAILSLTFDPALRISESMLPVFYQTRHRETRTLAWEWFRANFDRFLRRVPASEKAFLPLIGRRFCSEDAAVEVQAFFQPRMRRLPGAEEILAESLESIRLCAARAQAQSASTREFLIQQAGSPSTR